MNIGEAKVDELRISCFSIHLLSFSGRVTEQYRDEYQGAASKSKLSKSDGMAGNVPRVL